MSLLELLPYKIIPSSGVTNMVDVVFTLLSPVCIDNGYVLQYGAIHWCHVETLCS